MTKQKATRTKPWSDEERRQLNEAWSQIVEAFRPWVQGYYDLKHRLEGEGFVIRVDPDVFPSMAPVQLEGQLPSGEEFYFRGRGRQCSLRVAPPGGEPVAHPTWTYEAFEWEWPDAGALEAQEAEAVLHKFLARYEDEKAADASPRMQRSTASSTVRSPLGGS